MTLARPAAPPVSLSAPTVASTLASLERVLGKAAAMNAWSRACARAGVEGTAEAKLPVAKLMLVARELEAEGGLVGAMGVAVRVRCETYETLCDVTVPTSTPEHAELLSRRARLEDIAALGLHRRELDETLQEIARRAATELGLPIGLVSIVLDEAQYFAAHHGLEGWLGATRGTPVEWAFCQNAVKSETPFVVEDARLHPVVRDNPLVTNEGIRCYAGIPLVTTRGHALGTLCVIGTESRKFSDREMQRLHVLAREVMAHLERRRG